jgi:hypothetical protein
MQAIEAHMDEILLADSMEALRPAQGPRFLSLIPSDPTKKVAVVLPLQDKGKSPSPVRVFLWQGFLNPSPVVTHKCRSCLRRLLLLRRVRRLQVLRPPLRERSSG